VLLLPTMAWIEILPDDRVLAGKDKLARLYRALLNSDGTVDNVLKIHSLRPDTLDAHQRLYTAVMHTPGSLSMREREGMAVAVSAYNHCRY
jgi:alkylhydroperoxidase family enzyme